jgi:hypothetical protein
MQAYLQRHSVLIRIHTILLQLLECLLVLAQPGAIVNYVASYTPLTVLRLFVRGQQLLFLAL